MPRHICPNGQQCLNYSDHICSSPDMDGCMFECARGQDSEVAIAKKEMKEKCALVAENIKEVLGGPGAPTYLVVANTIAAKIRALK